ncbi:MAG: hypothetical protein QOE65_553 [Solirubrobacteraceae bacterium]|nr:hypothetical protein [Solirubrobacteraceae bacterium]
MPPRASVLLLACLLALPGCGGSSKPKPNDTRNRGGTASRLVDPTPRESVKDVIDRIHGAATASGCEAVKGLLHSTYGDVSQDACDAVKAEIDGFRSPHGAVYRTGAAIDYETTAGQHRTAAMVLDSDRTYRIDFVIDVPGATVGSPRAGAFDRNALAVVRAMQSGDCDAFLRLTARTIGLGVGPDAEVCRRVSDVPLRRELVANPSARPIPLGGNAWLAFYKLRTRPDAYYTMVMAREDTVGRGGASRYVLVNALPAG